MLGHLSGRKTVWIGLRGGCVRMIANIIIGAAIFGYATWAMVKFINKSKKGKCAACDLGKSCSSQSQCGIPPK